MVSAASPEFAPPRSRYRDWRDRKLAAYPRRAEELIVEVRDPRQLSAAERKAILERVARANMAVYASGCGDDPDKEIPRALARQSGLHRLDPNWLADDDGVSSIRAGGTSQRGEFIPYTSKPIRWHTDGYYNPPERRIRAFVLHCVHAAAQGGETQLLDPEIAWLLLNDANPAWARALMQPGAMTVPAHSGAREAQSGPVFSFDGEGLLHMRYTARTVSIQWARDPDTEAAARFLAQWLSDDAPFALRLKLAPGMGVICNNVLHTRSAFRDDAARPRLLYRARYYERITPL
ncbi:MAG: taurine catabolism dioxygenase TauD [Betaproteobacteria bacterium]|nr:MAG: taurine catabolism dioxygenase TauD [Betaproteobacteria bacterium]